MIELETPRLRLRQWRQEDRPVFARMNRDPVVMAYFPDTLNETESNEMADKLQRLIAQRGWGFWAVEEKVQGRFIGFVGLHIPAAELPFSPCVEIGWRLVKEYWGRGYATEAANAALRVAFERLALPEVYAFTPVGNERSQAVMRRLHMVNTHQNFDHPALAIGHPLREHVLFKLKREQWKKFVDKASG